MDNYCQRLISVTATGLEGRSIVVSWLRECRTAPWGELLTTMNPGEKPLMLTLCSSHYAEELTKAAPVADRFLWMKMEQDISQGYCLPSMNDTCGNCHRCSS